MSLPSRITKHDGGKCILLETAVWCPHMYGANLSSPLVSLCWHPPKWPIYKIAPWVGREGVVWISHIGLHNRAVFLVGRFQNSSHSWRNPFRTKHHPRSWGSEKPETSSWDFLIVLSGLFGAFEALKGWEGSNSPPKKRRGRPYQVSSETILLLGGSQGFSLRENSPWGKTRNFPGATVKILNNLNGWTQITRSKLNSNNQNRAQSFPWSHLCSWFSQLSSITSWSPRLLCLLRCSEIHGVQGERRWRTTKSHCLLFMV